MWLGDVGSISVHDAIRTSNMDPLDSAIHSMFNLGASRVNIICANGGVFPVKQGLVVQARLASLVLDTPITWI